MRAQVDPAICFSFAHCMEEAPRVFRFDAEGRTVAEPVPSADHDAVLAAAQACPVGAIRLFDDAGKELDSE